MSNGARQDGSAFGVWTTYRKEQVAMSGELVTYEHRSDESGRWIRMEFCPRCGTGIGATFDDPNWIDISRHI